MSDQPTRQAGQTQIQWCVDPGAHGETETLIRASGERWIHINGHGDSYAATEDPGYLWPTCDPCFGAVGPYSAVWFNPERKECRCSGCLCHDLRERLSAGGSARTTDRSLESPSTTRLTVTLNPTNFYTRWPCLCCGGQSGKDAVLADVLEDGTRTGYVVCPRCLADPDLAGTVRQTAARARADAAWLDAIAHDLPALPSLAEWEAAQVEAGVQFLIEAEGLSREAALAQVRQEETF